jgi:hypothetical protein
MKFKRRPSFKLNQSGAAHIVLPAIIVLAIGTVGYFAYQTLSKAHIISSVTPSPIVYSADGNLYTTDGSAPGAVLFRGPSEPAIGSAIWVSNASAIDYQYNNGLYTVNSSGQNPTNISVSGFTYNTISYSQAASELAYTGCITLTNSCGLYTSTATGTSPKLVFPLPAGDQWQVGGVSWSPNGKEIEAIYSIPGNNITTSVAIVVSSDGKKVTNLPTSYPAAEYCDRSGGYQWASNSQLICTAKNFQGLVKISDSGKGAKVIPNVALADSGTVVSNYSVSPDGKMIAYATQESFTGPSACRIYTIDINGKNNTLVYTGSGQLCTSLNWSSSSSSIVFGSAGLVSNGSTDGTGNLYTSNVPSTGAPVSVYSWTNGASPLSVEWSMQ